MIEAADYDPDLAGAYLLGADIRRVASARTREVLEHILADDSDRLALEMIKSVRHLENAEQRVRSRLRLLQAALA